jgi:hypothetical protein
VRVRADECRSYQRLFFKFLPCSRGSFSDTHISYLMNYVMGYELLVNSILVVMILNVTFLV